MSEFPGKVPLASDLAPVDEIVECLATDGYAIVPGFLPLAVARDLREEVLAYWQEGELKRAAVGRGEGKRLVAELRTDSIQWIDPQSLSVSQKIYWDNMQLLQQQVNRRLFLGLFDYEAQMARFSPGGYYKPHLDRHQQTQARVLSAVTYLDEDWQEEEGGALRLYLDPALGVDGPYRDIYPEAGKLVLFLAGEFWHEVRVAQRPRHSVTGWFRQREAVFG